MYVGINLDLGLNFAIKTDWSIINFGGTGGTVTVSAASSIAHSTVGNMVVPIGTSASFRTRVSLENNAITYRLS